MGEPLCTMRPSRAGGLRRRPSSASSTGSATVPSTRFLSAWWIEPCSTSGSCARWPTRLRKQRRREGENDAGHTGGVGASLIGSRKRRVGWLESSPGAKPARAYDILDIGAGCVVVDAAADALDKADDHAGPAAGSDAGQSLARSESAAGTTAL